MKSAFIVLAALAFASFAHADSIQQINLTATTNENTDLYGPNQPTENLDLMLTVEPETGYFFNPQIGTTFYGTEDEVVALSGTLNGQPVSLVSGRQSDPFTNGANGSWINLSQPDSFAIEFSINGGIYGGGVLWPDTDAINLLGLGDANGDGYGINVPVNVGLVIIPSPEPPVAWMLAAGLLLLALFRANKKGPESKLLTSA